MAGTIVNNPVVQFFDNNGRPLSGGKITTYLSNTTTPASTWQNEGLSVLNTNPIVLNSRGEATIWLTPDVQYTFVLTDADNNLIQTVNDIYGSFQPSNGMNASQVNYTAAGAGAVAIPQNEWNDQWVSVLGYGPVADGVTNDAPAIARADAVGDFMVPPGTYRIATNLTIANAVKFSKGAVFSLAPGVTLEFQSEIEAGYYSIFADAALSTAVNHPVTFSVEQTEVKAAWFNDIPNAALQAIVNNNQRYTPVTLLLTPNGSYTALGCEQLKNIIVDMQGSTVTYSSTLGGYLGGNNIFKQFPVGGGSTYTKSQFKIDNTKPRDRIVNLKDVNDAQFFSVGMPVLVCSYDQQGNGQPPCFRYFRFNEVESIVGTTITLREAVGYPHRDDYPEVSNDGSFGVARVLPAPDLAEYVEIKNGVITGTTQTNSAITPFGTKVAKMKNIRSGNTFPTVIRDMELDNCTLLGFNAGTSIEFDKIITNLTLRKSTLYAREVGSTAITNLRAYDSFLTSAGEIAENQYYENCTLAYDAGRQVTHGVNYVKFKDSNIFNFIGSNAGSLQDVRSITLGANLTDGYRFTQTNFAANSAVLSFSRLCFIGAKVRGNGVEGIISNIFTTNSGADLNIDFKWGGTSPVSGQVISICAFQKVEVENCDWAYEIEDASDPGTNQNTAFPTRLTSFHSFSASDLRLYNPSTLADNISAQGLVNVSITDTQATLVFYGGMRFNFPLRFNLARMSEVVVDIRRPYTGVTAAPRLQITGSGADVRFDITLAGRRVMNAAGNTGFVGGDVQVSPIFTATPEYGGFTVANSPQLSSADNQGAFPYIVMTFKYDIIGGLV